jgi:hypothetical protein
VLKHRFLIIGLFLIVFIAAANISGASPAPAEYETVTIPAVLTKNSPAVISIPAVLTQEREIESLTIAIEFDADALHPIEASLAGGILENKDYTLLSPINKRSAEERKIVIYADGSMIRGSGEIAFICFEIIGEPQDSTVPSLSLKTFLCNALPAPGGFGAGNAVCRHIQIIAVPDINNDGRIGLQEAVRLLQDAAKSEDSSGLKKAVCALQVLMGVKFRGFF